MSLLRVYATRVVVAAGLVCAPVLAFSQSSREAVIVSQPPVQFEFGGEAFSVSRTQDPAASLPKDFAKVARACPPECIEPSDAAPQVRNLTELDILDFMQGPVSAGTGLLVDARLPEDYATGTLPGAISVPAATLVTANPYREDLLLALGARGRIGNMDFSNAFDLLVFDAGPWSPVARDAITRLIEVGYPAEKLFYYRGGLQAWHILGLTVSR